MNRYFIIKCAIIMSSINLTSAATVTFKSEGELRQALLPHSPEEIRHRIATSKDPFPLQFQCDETISTPKLLPLRNCGSGKLLNTEVFKGKTISVFCPETPRVPHHLAIAFHRKEIQEIANVTEEENRELFATIKKVAEIYKTASIQGFVVAFKRDVVEILPHLPGFQEIKNIADKVDCNRHVLFPNANLSPVVYAIGKEAIAAQAAFWHEAFQRKSIPLTEKEIKISFPYIRKQSHQKEAEQILQQHLLELLQDRGGKIEENLSAGPIPMPAELSSEVEEIEVRSCAFCEEKVIEKQLVYEYKDILVFYNIRKGAKPGSNFLILPKRHTEKVYGLTPEEIEEIRVVRKALSEVLKEIHGGEVVIYIQDDPATGQTVFHSHEQMVAVDPKTMPLSWTLMCVYPGGNVCEEEMLKVRSEFGEKLREKLEALEESA